MPPTPWEGRPVPVAAPPLAPPGLSPAVGRPTGLGPGPVSESESLEVPSDRDGRSANNGCPPPPPPLLAPPDRPRTMFAVWAALMAARPGMRDRPWATMAASATGRRRQTTNGAKTATPMIAAPEIICPHACDELRQRCRPMLDACATPLDHQYKGMFDGPTNIDLDWDTSAGVVLNLSAVLDQAVPLELAMISGAGWGQALMHGHRDRLKLNVIDESYKALQDSAMVSYFLDGWRVAANSAAATWSSSTPSPNSEPNSDGAAAVKQTEALLNTTSVRCISTRTTTRPPTCSADSDSPPPKPADSGHASPPSAVEDRQLHRPCCPRHRRPRDRPVRHQQGHARSTPRVHGGTGLRYKARARGPNLASRRTRRGLPSWAWSTSPPARDSAVSRADAVGRSGATRRSC